MANAPRTLLDAALALPEGERAALAERLLESLLAPTAPQTDDEFYDELERRRAELTQNPATGIPWTDVLGDR